MIGEQTYVNLGCGRVILPGEQPNHHGLIDAEIYQHPHWLNVDRNDGPGVNMTADLFSYPWPFASDTFDGALLAHLVEHIPHAPTNGLQDGWFAFFSELWRVLKPGAFAWIIVPHGHSDGAKADPTHTRYVMPQTFSYLENNPESPFEYATGCNFRVCDMRYNITEPFRHLIPLPTDNESAAIAKNSELQRNIMTRINVCYEFAVKLEAVKE